ncbi:uncharacterized protein MELLADRAFT_102526 [Melampsora larici-populina 98AG31]|uniref:TRIP4/RQT4 C2HC5-type zinc finger domain-containing protein n=1 Tax=Melampsora larici-populina (strain 98AG31 / pathotype 3-4-7) TaxID=747676 RepID=F4R722_MELLP|nr:uncharacterized protein MELLADRAFT_102526 [Melampsora larici-populina 98AG31]EGG11502.1 hypothetical protein MELLADRAFT_102526 [Melampsora larici-populina 98AG31]
MVVMCLGSLRVEEVGFDQETVSSQLLPYLNSLVSKSEIQEYLKSLLGDGIEQDQFIKQIISSKFKESVPIVGSSKQKQNQNQNQKQHQNQNQLDFPTLNSKPKTNSDLSNSSRFIKVSSKPKKPFQNDSKEIGYQDMSLKFGSCGNVYVKDKGKDLNGLKVVKKPTHEQGTDTNVGHPSTSSSQRTSDLPEPSLKEEKITRLEDSLGSKSGRVMKVSDLTIPLSEPILRELFELERIITSLQTGPDSDSKPKPNSKNPKNQACFCSGRLHGLPSSPLPNRCSYCGMIYCRNKLPFSSCPSCSRLDLVFQDHQSKFKESILSYFESKRQESIQLEINKFERLQENFKRLRLTEENRQREFPDLSTIGSKALNDHQGIRHSYVDQVSGVGSIEDRIREGYRNLQNSTSRTVLRLDSKSGQTKVVKTTKTIKNQTKSKTEVQEENFMKLKEIEEEVLGLKTLDQTDDGFRISLGLEPVFSNLFEQLGTRVVKVVEMMIIGLEAVADKTVIGVLAPPSNCIANYYIAN